MATDSADLNAASPPKSFDRAGWAENPAIAAIALISLAAGFLHAAVISAHEGHGNAATVFTALAVFQIGWAAAVMARPSRPVLFAGAVVNAATVAGYIVSRTAGISFIDGFEEKEAVGFTDAVTTGLEAVLVVGLVAIIAAGADRRLWPTGQLGMAALGIVGVSVALVGVPAVSNSGDHPHGQEEAAGGHGQGHGHEQGDAEMAGHAHGGDEGPVTPEQQAAADQLLADTMEGLWKWTDDEAVHEAGFRTIGDGPTGTEHLVNWDWINDDVVLDPAHPESLVYRVTKDGGRVLEAAMFMAPAGTPDDEVPDVGGALTQWHIHDNLCYGPVKDVDGSPERHVVGLTNNDGECDRGEALTPHAPMLHVWVVPQKCGPFSSLEGVGAGQAIEEVKDPLADPECQHSEH